MSTINQLQNIATQIRRDIVRMVYEVQSGHPGGSLGCADFLTALFFEHMQYSADNFKMNGNDEDLFFLSNGHISPVYYATLARAGYFPVSELKTFRRLNTRLQGHPTTHDHLPGVRIATGSLGQGLSVSVGAALSKKLNKDTHIVYTLLGDGELQEGQNWEAIMFAAHHKVDNLIATVDWNGVQIDGPNDSVISLGDLKAKWTAFGWQVLEMQGNDMENIVQVLKQAKLLCGNGKPICLLMKTAMGFGVDFMHDNYKWHGSPPNESQTASALAQLTETLGDY
jgi:transketolase